MNDFEKLISDSKPTLVDFFATWCGPCKVQSSILEEVKKKIGDEANVVKIDIDHNESLAAQYSVRSVPTLILFKNSEVVWRAVGVQPVDVLEMVLRDHI